MTILEKGGALDTIGIRRLSGIMAPAIARGPPGARSCAAAPPARTQAARPEGLPGAAHAEVDGLALTPPMGWYPWNIFGQEPQNEKLIREIADALVASGMKDAGYAYVGPDEGICFSRGGRRQADDEPGPLSARACAAWAMTSTRKGLKYALYTDAGTKTCSQAMPGTKGHEFEDMRAFAEWRADYIKIDWCNTRGPGHRPDLLGAGQGPARRRPPRRPQPVLVGRRLSLGLGRRHRAHVADDDRHLRPRDRPTGPGPCASPSPTRSWPSSPAPAAGTTPT
ncbi:MAG: hypothetical protein M0C28_47680 [Candidatus Moduliflexus flocculans]|nr:hypothetical protein [Candidatus Moduliflexus flocculans]